ncbi:uncharacterized protein LOC126717127 isoform X2 [Quercus robur]|uniref:uncharacterized protein LOC126717127 isoform X2 n=1 Tax=Quercus robur TaxID=38942 RepID=UPI0021626F84|nr:uncharacterized protein LOC126717127 isoform X2 [Quercus robur]
MGLTYGNGFDLGSSSIANPFIKNDSIFNLYPPSKKPSPMRRNMPRARWTSAYVSTLHCEILSSFEQIPNFHFQHYRLFTLLYGPIIILWGRTIELSYLSCLLLCFEAPILKMKMGSSDFVLVGEYWVVFKAISAYFNIKDPDLMIDMVTGQDGLLLMSTLSTEKFSVLSSSA